jgi:hypothetical protein
MEALFYWADNLEAVVGGFDGHCPKLGKLQL